MKRLTYVVIMLFYFSCPASGAELRKLGEYDLSWGPYGTTWTSPGGKEVRYIPRFFDNNAFTDNLTLYGSDLIVKSPWVDVRAFGAIADNTTNLGTSVMNAIAALPSGGGDILIPVGDWRLSSGISGTKLGVTIRGAGKNATRIWYTGSDNAITWGAKGVNGGGKVRFAVKDLSLIGTSSALNGINLTYIQDWRLDQVSVDGFTKSGAAALLLTEATNSGLSTNSDYINSDIGVFITTSGDPNYTSTNLNTFVGGQITGDNLAIKGTVSSFSNKFYAANIAATKSAPAVSVVGANNWILEGNFFEANKSGADTSSVEISGLSNVLRSNLFVENNVTYAVRIKGGVGNVVGENFNGSANMTSLVLVDAQASQTMVPFNYTSDAAIAILIDNSGSQNTMGVGFGTDFRKGVSGYLITDALSGTAASPFKLQSPATGINTVTFRDPVANTVGGISPYNIRGAATFSSAGTKSISFTGNEVNTSYFIALGCSASTEKFGWTNKAVNGFTITSDNTTSTATCDWILIR